MEKPRAETAAARRLKDERAPAISIVLPVLNEARDIGRLLGEITSQATPRGGFEVLVVDGGSTDGTREIVSELSREHPHLRLLENPRKLSSAGRNVGVRAAKGEYVLFLDGHCSIPRQDYLTRTIELFESTGADCLCRPQPLQRLIDGKWAKAISIARHSWLGHNQPSDIYGGDPAFTDPRSAGAAYPRREIVRLGGYDERFDACEDVEFNHRVATAGLAAYRHPDLQIDYRPRPSLRSLYGQMIRYGRGRARLMIRHFRVFPWPLILITAFLLAVLLGLPIMGVRAAGLILGIAAAFWVLTIGAESLRLAGPTREAARIASAFFVIYVGLTLGFWRGLAEWRRFRLRPSE